MPQRAMLEFATRADDCALAVAFDRRVRHGHCRQQPLRHVEADRLERFHGVFDFRFVAAGERVRHHRGNRATPQRLRGCGTELVENVFDVRQHAAYFEHGASVVIPARFQNNAPL